MYSHHGNRSKSRKSRSSKFTAHAAVQLQSQHNNSTSIRYDGAAAGQLLENLGRLDSIPLKRLVHETFPTCNVDLIHVVNAPQMYGMYLLRKEEMCLTDGGYRDKELTLYHVTTKSRALESLISGLDWRRTRRSKFGRGVSFSDDADYANYYADKFTNEDSRVIIVCAVIVNKTKLVSGNRDDGNLIVPPGNADTTVSSNGRVYVKYNDYEFYPMYLMYYQRAPEHLYESKYFRNNPRKKSQQNNRAMHLQQQQELKAQREREKEQRAQQVRVQQRARRKLRREEQEAQARRIEQEEELMYSRQAQAQRRKSNRNCLIL